MLLILNIINIFKDWNISYWFVLISIVTTNWVSRNYVAGALSVHVKVEKNVFILKMDAKSENEMNHSGILEDQTRKVNIKLYTEIVMRLGLL